MKGIVKPSLVIAIVLAVIAFAYIVTNLKYKQKRKLAEWAYFEGQVDALNNDIRIKQDTANGCWVWTKSPWDSGRSPKFNPCE